MEWMGICRAVHLPMHYIPLEWNPSFRCLSWHRTNQWRKFPFKQSSAATIKCCLRDGWGCRREGDGVWVSNWGNFTAIASAIGLNGGWRWFTYCSWIEAMRQGRECLLIKQCTVWDSFSALSISCFYFYSFFNHLPITSNFVLPLQEGPEGM